MAGFVVLLVAVIANLFLHIPALSLVKSVMFILFARSCGKPAISSMVATVSLYVSLYSIFVSLLSIFGGMRSN